MTKRESKVRAADQIVRLNPDIFGDVILRASDISLLIDTAGLILEVIYNTENKNLGDIEHWRTRNIRDFITKESGIKLEEILNLSSTENEKIEKDIIQLNHIKNGGDDFPIQYSIHPTGVNNQILLFGRDLTQIAQAQQELMKTQLKFEREYDRYRSFDTKYRVILEQCGSAFIIVDEAGQLIDFNQKAVAILEKADLNQMMLKDLFYQGISIDILSELETLNKNTPSTALNLNVKETNKEVQLKGTFFRSNDGVHSLIRLSSSSSQRTSHSKEKIYLSDLYQKTSDAFVFIDEAGKIVDTNESFLILTENPNIDEVVGKSFSDFLKNATTDLKILTDNSKRLGKIRNYATDFITTFGSKIPVTISSTWVSNEDDDFYGFILRDSSNIELEKQNDNEKHSWEATTKLVGSAPLKELVAQTGDIAERICLETALNLTNNNKVAAAELLSLSRQSLYVKLRKHNLLDIKD